MKRFVIIVFILINFISCRKEDNILKIIGKGTVDFTPDYTNLSFSIISKNKDHKICQDENSKVSQDVFMKLQNKYGIQKENIKTINYSLRNEKDYINEKTFKIFYISENKMKVKILKLNDLNNIISDIINLGVTEIDNIDFELSNYNDLEKKALALAYINAEEKAKVVSANSKFKIKGVKNINELQNDSYFNEYNLKGPPGFDNNVPPSYYGSVNIGIESIRKYVIVDFLIQ